MKREDELEDDPEVCDICQGEGTIIVGDFDDQREVKCPHVVRDEQIADANNQD